MYIIFKIYAFFERNFIKFSEGRGGGKKID